MSGSRFAGPFVSAAPSAVWRDRFSVCRDQTLELIQKLQGKAELSSLSLQLNRLTDLVNLLDLAAGVSKEFFDEQRLRVCDEMIAVAAEVRKQEAFHCKPLSGKELAFALSHTFASVTVFRNSSFDFDALKAETQPGLL